MFTRARESFHHFFHQGTPPRGDMDAAEKSFLHTLCGSSERLPQVLFSAATHIVWLDGGRRLRWQGWFAAFFFLLFKNSFFDVLLRTTLLCCATHSNATHPNAKLSQLRINEKVLSFSLAHFACMVYVECLHFPICSLAKQQRALSPRHDDVSRLQAERKEPLKLWAELIRHLKNPLDALICADRKFTLK